MDVVDTDGFAARTVLVPGEAMALLVGPTGVALEHVDQVRVATAGAETNVAIGLARLGHHARWLGVLGDDALGVNVLRRLRADGVDTTAVRRTTAGPTGVLVRDSHPGRAIQVGYYRAASAATTWSPSDVPDDVVHGVDHVHVTGITPMLSDSCAAATTRLLELAGAAGVPVSVDPNLRLRLAPVPRWRAVVAPLLARATVVLAGADELAALDVPVDALLRAGVETVVVKEDDKSLTAHTPDGTTMQPPFPVTAVDSVGAGDAFAAGLLSARLEGEPVAEQLRRGALVASLVVQGVSDTDGLPYRRDLVATADGTVHR